MSERVLVARITTATGIIQETIYITISTTREGIIRAKQGLKALYSYQYPSTNSRQSISLNMLDFSLFELIHAYSRHNISYNPYVDFLSYFQTNYITATLVDTSCDQINLYNTLAMEDATIVTIIIDI